MASHGTAAIQDEAQLVVPLEILGIIFELVFANSQAELKLPPSSRLRFPEIDGPHEKLPPLMGWPPEEDLRSPTIFPYALASVCTQWRDALSMEPTYWTRVVIYIDSSPTPLSNVRDFMDWSRDLPVDVTITRRTGGYANHPDERGRVAAVTKIIMPHLNRIRTLAYDVFESFSLAAVTREIHGPASLLTSLKLESCVDGGDPDPMEPNNRKGEHLLLPLLECLTLAGCNMIDICSDPPRWINALPMIKGVSISHGVVEGVSTREVLETLSKLPTLLRIQIKGVDFRRESNFTNAQPLVFYGRAVDLEDVGDNLVGEVFSNTDEWESMHITRSPINPIPQICAYYVSLTEISATQDLSGFLRDWDGGSLALTRCPGFDDNEIARICDDGKNRSMDYDMLTNLIIEDCPNYTTEGLKKLVELYRHAESKVMSLEIRGQTPRFSAQDLKWFAEKVEYFYYLGKLQSLDEEEGGDGGELLVG